MFGGGFALAKGAEDSGLAAWIGSKMVGLSNLNIVSEEGRNELYFYDQLIVFIHLFIYSINHT